MKGEFNSDSFFPDYILQPLTISEVENYHYVDSAQQTEGPRIGDEQSQIVESEASVKESKLLCHST